MKKKSIAKISTALTIICISIFVIYKKPFTHNEYDVNHLDKIEINGIKKKFSENATKVTDIADEISQENLTKEILKISNNLYLAVEDNSIPDLELLSILSNQMKNSSQGNTQRMAEEKIKILLIQYSNLNSIRKSALKEYFEELTKASQINNSKIISDILRENPNSPVFNDFNKIKG